MNTDSRDNLMVTLAEVEEASETKSELASDRMTGWGDHLLLPQ